VRDRNVSSSPQENLRHTVGPDYQIRGFCISKTMWKAAVFRLKVSLLLYKGRDISTPGNTKGSRNTLEFFEFKRALPNLLVRIPFWIPHCYRFAVVIETFERKIFFPPSSSQEEKQRHDHHRKSSVLQKISSSYSRFTHFLEFHVRGIQYYLNIRTRIPTDPPMKGETG
jgi:hypothetical protein